MAYAARHPEHVSRLLICDSAAPKWSDTEFMFKQFYPDGVAKQDGMQFAEAMGDSAMMREDIRVYMGMLFWSPKNRDRYMVNLAKYPYDLHVNKLLNDDLARFDLNPELPKFKCPTLVMTGRYDANVAPSTAWKIYRAIPGARFHVFESSGHLPWFEEPDAFVTVVEEFLGTT
jgi:proline iminopeptidase